MKNRTLDRKIKRPIGALLAFAGVVCLPYIWNLEGESLIISNSWFGVFLWGVLWFLTDKALAVSAKAGADDGFAVGDAFAAKEKLSADNVSLCGRKPAAEGRLEEELPKERQPRERRQILAAGLSAFFFSVCLAFGTSLEQWENVVFGNGMMWLSIVVWAAIFTLWICKGWELLEERNSHKNRAAGTGNVIETNIRNLVRRWEEMPEKKRAALLFCFFVLCWLPVFLAVYPGFFVYDAQDEFVQVETRQFTTHHPLPHVLMLGGIILAVHKLTGSYNLGIAAYTLFQMCLLSGVFTYVLSYMRRCGVKRMLRIITALYFAFFPVVVMFTLCSAKDGIFTAALLLLLISIYEMAKQGKNFFASRSFPILFCASAVVMMCFRHNGLYAFLVMVPLLFYAGNGIRKKLGFLLGITFALYFVISGALTAALSASDSENQEMLTVPIQQLARVYKYDKESLSQEEIQKLYEIIPEEALRFYAPKVSDGVKVWFQNEAFAAEPGKYAGLWLKIGMKHPFTYLNAWFMTSYGFWYPDTVIDVYRGNGVFTFTYEDSSFFGYEVEAPGKRESKIPWLDECYRRMSLEIAQQKIPVLSMAFSPGFLFWIFVFTAGYAFYRRNYKVLLPFALIFLVWLTVILGPTYLPRYVLILWFALPGAAAVLAEG